MSGFKGMQLFLQYSKGCRMYCEGKGMISDSDLKALDSSNPSLDVLRRVFYAAIPVMEKIAKRRGKELFDIEVLREFYSGEHNERKFREGELACLSFPALVTEKNGNDYLIEMKPVNGKFWTRSGLDLNEGDWVVMHRIELVEKIPESFAIEMMDKLKEMGLDKTYKFPKAAIKYLKKLQKDGTHEFKDKYSQNGGSKKT